jgi:hypothetical protein
MMGHACMDRATHVVSQPLQAACMHEWKRNAGLKTAARACVECQTVSHEIMHHTAHLERTVIMLALAQG